MYGGIDQLVNTYKGNPQPLQAKVQQAQGQMQNQMKQQVQQGQPPGAIPPDLEEALALQKITELRQGAQNQQAMQAGGAQPTVVQKLHQMLGAQQAQAQAPQMQGQPVMAASGGSIAHLVSNLGRHYAGGGIVAFKTGGNEGLSEEDKKAKQREEDRKALLSPLAAVGDIAQLPIAATYNLAADTGSGLERFLNRVGSALTGQEVNTQSDDQVGNKFRFSPTPFMDMLNKPAGKGVAASSVYSSVPGGKGYNLPEGSPGVTVQDTYTDKNGVRQARPPNVSDEAWAKHVAKNAGTEQTPTSQGLGDKIVPRYPITASTPKPPVPTVNAPAAPRPTAVNPGISGGPAKPTTEPMDPVEKAIRDSIMKTMGQDPEEVRRKAIEANAKAMGLDALLKPGQERAANREAMIKQIQADRQPLWITALQNAGNKPGNVAQVLNQMATGVSTAKQGYNAQDLKFLEELDALHASNDKARIEGRYKDLAAGEAAVKDLISSQRQAEQSGTSLLNKQATLAQTKQIADDNRKSREMINAANLEATKAKRLQDQNNFLANLHVKHEALLNSDKDYQGMIKQKQMLELQMVATQDEAKRAKLAEQLDTQQAKMATYAAGKIGGGTMAGAGALPPGAKFLGFEPKKT